MNWSDSTSIDSWTGLTIAPYRPFQVYLNGLHPISLSRALRTRFAQGVTRTVETDRAALVALYNSTNGTSWTYRTNWNTTAELSTWFGVSTDADGLVRYLELNYNQLSGPLPTELGDLTNLTYLSLTGNQLSGSIPAELGDLTNLEEL